MSRALWSLNEAAQALGSVVVFTYPHLSQLHFKAHSCTEWVLSTVWLACASHCWCHYMQVWEYKGRLCPVITSAFSLPHTTLDSEVKYKPKHDLIEEVISLWRVMFRYMTRRWLWLQKLTGKTWSYMKTTTITRVLDLCGKYWQFNWQLSWLSNWAFSYRWSYPNHKQRIHFSKMSPNDTWVCFRMTKQHQVVWEQA